MYYSVVIVPQMPFCTNAHIIDTLGSYFSLVNHKDVRRTTLPYAYPMYMKIVTFFRIVKLLL